MLASRWPVNKAETARPLVRKEPSVTRTRFCCSPSLQAVRAGSGEPDPASPWQVAKGGQPSLSLTLLRFRTCQNALIVYSWARLLTHFNWFKKSLPVSTSSGVYFNFQRWAEQRLYINDSESQWHNATHST